MATTCPSETASPVATVIWRSVPASSTITGICIFIDSMNSTGSPDSMRSPTFLSIRPTTPVTSVLASNFAIVCFPHPVMLVQSGACRPVAHEMSPHTTRHAQPMHIEHADQIIARRVGFDDRLHGVDAGDVPGLAVLAHLREGRLEAGLARRQAVDNAHCKGR